MRAHLRQRPAADIADETGLLRHRHEVAGRDLAALRVEPAQQGFSARHLQAVRVVLGLVVHLEQLVLERSPQLHLERQSLDRARVHGAGVETELVAAGGLGFVHGEVGVLHQCLSVGAVLGKQRNADARRHHKLIPALDERCGEGVLDALRRLLGVAGGRLAGEHHDELIAADPRQLAAGAGVGERAAEPLGHLAEERIAGLVAQGIVDALELVEIDEQQRHRRWRSSASRSDADRYSPIHSRFGSPVRASK